jgi:hypothetical protein
MRPSEQLNTLIALNNFIYRGVGNTELPGDIRCASPIAVECQSGLERFWPERYYHTRLYRGSSGLNETILMLGGRTHAEQNGVKMRLNMTCTSGAYPCMALQASVFDGEMAPWPETLNMFLVLKTMEDNEKRLKAFWCDEDGNNRAHAFNFYRFWQLLEKQLSDLKPIGSTFSPKNDAVLPHLAKVQLSRHL